MGFVVICTFRTVKGQFLFGFIILYYILLLFIDHFHRWHRYNRGHQTRLSNTHHVSGWILARFIIRQTIRSLTGTRRHMKAWVGLLLLTLITFTSNTRTVNIVSYGHSVPESKGLTGSLFMLVFWVSSTKAQAPRPCGAFDAHSEFMFSLHLEVKRQAKKQVMTWR